MPGHFIEHRGQRVLVADYSRSPSHVETVADIQGVQRLIDAEPRGAVRCLIDVTDLRFNGDVIAAFREAGARSKPAFLASAVVGLSGLQRSVYKMITTALRMEIPAFATRAEALDWLAAQR